MIARMKATLVGRGIWVTPVPAHDSPAGLVLEARETDHWRRNGGRSGSITRTMTADLKAGVGTYRLPRYQWISSIISIKAR